MLFVLYEVDQKLIKNIKVFQINFFLILLKLTNHLLVFTKFVQPLITAKTVKFYAA